MDKRNARRLASGMLAAAARRLGAETKDMGYAPRDRTRIEQSFEALAEEMDGRAGIVGPPAQDPDQIPLFDQPRKDPTDEA